MPALARIERTSLQRVGGGALVARAGRHVDDDAAGRLALPGLSEGEHLGALHRRQAAAPAPTNSVERARRLP